MKSTLIAFSILFCLTSCLFANNNLAAQAIKNTSIIELKKAVLTADQTCKRLHGNMASWNVALKQCQCNGGSYMLGIGVNSPCLPIP